ncbi:MAG TPA: hypothetical protein VF132_14875 [Rudaea sp.]
MFRKSIASLSCALAALFCIDASIAAYEVPVAVDHAFGQDGFAAVPPFGPTYIVDASLGFVQFKHNSSDYLYVTMQHSVVDGFRGIVATRFAPDGSIVQNWAMNGQLRYDGFYPYFSTARLAERFQPGRPSSPGHPGSPDAQYVYIAATILTARGDIAYAVADIDVTQGAPIGTSFSAPLGHPPGVGYEAQRVGWIDASDDVLVAGMGATTAAGNVVDIFRLVGNPGTIDTSGGTWNEFSTPRDFRVNQMIPVGTQQLLDLVGGDGGTSAIYVQYDRNTRSVAQYSYVTLPCAVGEGTARSTADGIVRDTETLRSDVLLYGRSDCNGVNGTHASISRIANVGFAAIPLWTVHLDGAETDSSCSNFVGYGCDRSYVGLFKRKLHPNDTADATFVIAAGLDGTIRQIDLSFPDNPVVTGVEFNVGDLTVTPSLSQGTVLDYPTMVAPATKLGQYGLARVAIDRIFADGERPQ